MASIVKLHVDYFDHPKVVRLAGLLGKGAEVLPIRLWCHCGKHHRATGELTGYSAQEVEKAAGWWGVRGRCVAVMLELGLLDVAPGGFSVHDWGEWQGRPEAGGEAVQQLNSGARERGGGRGGCLLPLSFSSEFQNQKDKGKDKTNTHQSAPNLGAARGIADAYRLQVTAAHGFRGAKEVRALLAAGELEAELMAAVEHAAAWYEREGRAAEKRPACWTFFGSDEWRGFVESVPPPARGVKANGKTRVSDEQWAAGVL